MWQFRGHDSLWPEHVVPVWKERRVHPVLLEEPNRPEHAWKEIYSGYDIYVKKGPLDGTLNTLEINEYSATKVD